MNAERKEKLLIRAEYKCEYCKKDIQDLSHQIDHILPQSISRDDSEFNLAISCERCNKNKSNFTEWIDQYTGRSVNLFNPRLENWDSHFRKTNNEIVGITEIGRATASLLFTHKPQYIPGDLNWDKIQEFKSDHSVYRFLNHLRYRRLRNDFNALERLLNIDLPEHKDSSPIVQNQFAFVKNLLRLELYFTRSTSVDVDKGIMMGTDLMHKNLTQSQKAETSNILSILHQQKATVLFGLNKFKESTQHQNRAVHYFFGVKKIDFSSKSFIAKPNQLGDFLRFHSIKTKFESNHISQQALKVAVDLVRDEEFFTNANFKYLTDLILTSQNLDYKSLEFLYEPIDEILKTQGYGSSVDQAKMVTLRRRWWALNFVLNNVNDLSTLDNDLKNWQKIEMKNEIRELNNYLVRLSKSHKIRSAKDISELIKNYS